MRSKLAAAMLASCVGAVAVVNAAGAAEVVVSSLGPGNFVLTALIAYPATSNTAPMSTHTKYLCRTFSVPPADFGPR